MVTTITGVKSILNKPQSGTGALILTINGVYDIKNNGWKTDLYLFEQPFLDCFILG